MRFVFYNYHINSLVMGGRQQTPGRLSPQHPGLRAHLFLSLFLNRFPKGWTVETWVGSLCLNTLLMCDRLDRQDALTNSSALLPHGDGAGSQRLLGRQTLEGMLASLLRIC